VEVLDRLPSGGCYGCTAIPRQTTTNRQHGRRPVVRVLCASVGRLGARRLRPSALEVQLGSDRGSDPGRGRPPELRRPDRGATGRVELDLRGYGVSAAYRVSERFSLGLSLVGTPTTTPRHRADRAPPPSAGPRPTTAASADARAGAGRPIAGSSAPSTATCELRRARRATCAVGSEIPCTRATRSRSLPASR